MLDTDRHNPMKGRCLALFPGAFRPPHEAHLTAVLNLASRPDIDEVIVIIANRSRLIPGTTKALDANVARRIWNIYLKDVAKVRVEIAPHTAIRHALAYFDRVKVGDTLLFCIGQSDFEQGDERFEAIRSLSERTGIEAQIAAAPTGSLQVRATPLRAALALGESGREAFVTALPACLTANQQDQVWRICRTGMREASAIVCDKIAALIDHFALGQVVDLHVIGGNRIDPVFGARLADGCRLIVKYAGDTVDGGTLGEAHSLKPNQRLAAERRALKFLHVDKPCGIQLSEVVHFDKETRTLVMTDACPGGHRLQDDLKKGIFNLEAARAASEFLARCHMKSENLRPMWGDNEADLRHWQQMLARRTVGLAKDGILPLARRDLDILMQASLEASDRHFLHLDYSPRNILVSDGKLAVIDFELCSSVGDPACDLGYFFGHYVLWGFSTSARQSCQAALREMFGTYRKRVGDLWLGMHRRVVAFAGAGLLDSVIRDRQVETMGFENQLISTAVALLATGESRTDEPALLLSDAVAGRFIQ